MYTETRKHAKAVGALGALVQVLADAGTDPETLEGLEDAYEVLLQSPPPGVLFEPECSEEEREGWEAEGANSAHKAVRY